MTPSRRKQPTPRERRRPCHRARAHDAAASIVSDGRGGSTVHVWIAVSSTAFHSEAKAGATFISVGSPYPHDVSQRKRLLVHEARHWTGRMDGRFIQDAAIRQKGALMTRAGAREEHLQGGAGTDR